MIVIDPNKITGKQAYKLIKSAMKTRSMQQGRTVPAIEFCRDSGVSKMHAHRLSRGKKPGLLALHKIAAGLEKWGHKVTVKKLLIKF